MGQYGWNLRNVFNEELKSRKQVSYYFDFNMQKLYIVFTFLQLNTTNSTLDTYQQHISDLILKPDLNRSWAKIVNIGTELRFISHPTMAAVPGMVLHMRVLRHCWFNEWIRYTKSLVEYSEIRKSNLSPQHSETWNWRQVAQKPLNCILILNSLMPTVTDNSKREQEFWGMWRKDERFKPDSGSNLKKWKFKEFSFLEIWPSSSFD